MATLFSLKTIEQITESLGRYLPPERLFESKFNPQKNLYMFLRGVAAEFQRANDLLREYNIQYYPDQTIDFIDEWEQTLGLPDDCFTQTISQLNTFPFTFPFEIGSSTLIDNTSIVERRRNILIKLAGMSLQTDKDFENTAALLGITTNVVGGADPLVSPPILPIEKARFTIVVLMQSNTTFPLTFPIIFGTSEFSILECVFRKAKPANCDLIFQVVPEASFPFTFPVLFEP
jgi:uncharacterized protein YmfQ (DUF2313 family)